ncbi:MAG TPA: hypothetical protein VF686_06080, partial [Brevundimonas sp.]
AGRTCNFGGGGVSTRCSAAGATALGRGVGSMMLTSRTSRAAVSFEAFSCLASWQADRTIALAAASIRAFRIIILPVAVVFTVT